MAKQKKKFSTYGSAHRYIAYCSILYILSWYLTSMEKLAFEVCNMDDHVCDVNAPLCILVFYIVRLFGFFVKVAWFFLDVFRDDGMYVALKPCQSLFAMREENGYLCYYCGITLPNKEGVHADFYHPWDCGGTWSLLGGGEWGFPWIPTWWNTITVRS